MAPDTHWAAIAGRRRVLGDRVDVDHYAIMRLRYRCEQESR